VRSGTEATHWIAFGGGIGQHATGVGSTSHTSGGPFVGVASTSMAPSAERFAMIEVETAAANVVGIDATGAANGGGGPFSSSGSSPTAIVGVPYVPSGGYRYVWAAPDGVHHGMAAIEVFHPDHPEPDVQRYRALAGTLGLAVTGGSDYHGPGTGRAAALGRIGLMDDAFHALMFRATGSSQA
jgi:hypothetical protein